MLAGCIESNSFAHNLVGVFLGLGLLLFIPMSTLAWWRRDLLSAVKVILVFALACGYVMFWTEMFISGL
jgi:hypothetical protein